MTTLYPALICGRDVTTEYIYPPIPDRSHDWVAFFDAEMHPYGYGATEDEAIADLGTLYDDGFFEPAAIEKDAA